MRELIYRIANEVDSMTIGEKFLGGLMVTLFSMLMVFSVLVLLMFVIKTMGAVFNKKPKQTNAETVTEIKSSANESQETSIAEESAQTDENEVVAAIIAAVNAVKTSEDSKIVIRQIAKNQSNWANSGLIEQINSRL